MQLPQESESVSDPLSQIRLKLRVPSRYRSLRIPPGWAVTLSQVMRSTGGTGGHVWAKWLQACPICDRCSDRGIVILLTSVDPVRLDSDSDVVILSCFERLCDGDRSQTDGCDPYRSQMIVPTLNLLFALARIASKP
jgi:hypothetical protein